ncbi:MAG: VanZ family protein [Desulfoprunum sp.]|jgi:VanZ family protein|uniref:VanZ family protein n=1 Tax=Desulfoprunum sp. TaxID=2020866 RepID=UPI003C786213
MSRSLPAPARLLPAIGVMAAIFLLSHQQADDLPPLFPHFDKIAHFFIYGLLAAALVGAFEPDLRQRRPWPVVGIVVIWCLVYGLSDEFHQSFIPGRFPSLADIVADTFGAVVVSAGWVVVQVQAGKRAVGKESG